MNKTRGWIVAGVLILAASGCGGGSDGSTADKPDPVAAVSQAQAKAEPNRPAATHAVRTSTRKARKRERSSQRAPKQAQILAATKRGKNKPDHLSAHERRLRDIGSKRQGKNQKTQLSPREQKLLEIGSKSPEYQP
jgi:hypothetical protein